MRKLHTLFLCLFFLVAPTNAQDNAVLFKAIEGNDTNAVEAALVAGANANAVNETGGSALYEAVRKQSIDMARMLIAKGADVNFVNEQNIGATPLMMAAAYNEIPIVNLLLETGADVNLPDTNGDPAINWAAYYGYTDVAEQLLKAGADTEQVGHGNPREIAMRRGHQDFVRLMARAAEIELPSPDTALLIEGVATENMDAIEDALALGTSANATDFSGRPILGLAARTGNVELVARLVEAGAEADAVDEIGFSPLMEAVRDNKIDVARYLISLDADVNRRSYANALYLTPMHMAGLSGNPDMVQLLADAGADIDPKGRENGTPLLWTLGEGKMDAVMKLLELGADPHHKNSYGFSAADFARQMENADLLKKMGEPATP